MPTHPDRPASYAVRVPRCRVSPRASSRPRLTTTPLPPARGKHHLSPQGTFTPKQSPMPGIHRRHDATRRATDQSTQREPPRTVAGTADSPPVHRTIRMFPRNLTATVTATGVHNHAQLRTKRRIGYAPERTTRTGHALFQAISSGPGWVQNKRPPRPLRHRTPSGTIASYSG
jgi:hypothetical protein